MKRATNRNSFCNVCLNLIKKPLHFTTSLSKTKKHMYESNANEILMKKINTMDLKRESQIQNGNVMNFFRTDDYHIVRIKFKI